MSLNHQRDQWIWALSTALLIMLAAAAGAFVVMWTAQWRPDIFAPAQSWSVALRLGAQAFVVFIAGLLTPVSPQQEKPRDEFLLASAISITMGAFGVVMIGLAVADFAPVSRAWFGIPFIWSLGVGARAYRSAKDLTKSDDVHNSGSWFGPALLVRLSAVGLVLAMAAEQFVVGGADPKSEFNDLIGHSILLEAFVSIIVLLGAAPSIAIGAFRSRNRGSAHTRHRPTNAMPVAIGLVWRIALGALALFGAALLIYLLLPGLWSMLIGFLGAISAGIWGLVLAAAATLAAVAAWLNVRGQMLLASVVGAFSGVIATLAAFFTIPACQEEPGSILQSWVSELRCPANPEVCGAHEIRNSNDECECEDGFERNSEGDCTAIKIDKPVDVPMPFAPPLTWNWYYPTGANPQYYWDYNERYLVGGDSPEEQFFESAGPGICRVSALVAVGAASVDDRQGANDSIASARATLLAQWAAEYCRSQTGAALPIFALSLGGYQLGEDTNLQRRPYLVTIDRDDTSIDRAELEAALCDKSVWPASGFGFDFSNYAAFAEDSSCKSGFHDRLTHFIAP